VNDPSGKSFGEIKSGGDRVLEKRGTVEFQGKDFDTKQQSEGGVLIMSA